jgi:hypothetical protein
MSMLKMQGSRDVEYDFVLNSYLYFRVMGVVLRRKTLYI